MRYLDPDERFLARVRNTVDEAEVHDIVLDRVVELLRDRRFQKLDEILDKIQIEEYSTSTVIAFLCSTFRAKKVLENRAKLLCSARRYWSLFKNQKEVEKLLKGLD